MILEAPDSPWREVVDFIELAERYLKAHNYLLPMTTMDTLDVWNKNQREGDRSGGQQLLTLIYELVMATQE
jgi:hypothetical protein